jgi:hypothetical protein
VCATDCDLLGKNINVINKMNGIVVTKKKFDFQVRAKRVIYVLMPHLQMA